jgi:hypothetical protein
MKVFRYILVAALMTVSLVAAAQMEQPVRWKVSSSKVGDNIYEIKATGSITGNWHIYDLEDYGKDGPNGTAFTVSGDNVKIVGKPYITSKVNRAHDDIFDMEIGTCGNPVVICQKVELVKDAPVSVPVTIEWQACNDMNCLPPTEFTQNVELPAKIAAVKELPAPKGAADDDSLAAEDNPSDAASEQQELDSEDPHSQ